MLPLEESMGWIGAQSKNIMRAMRASPQPEGKGVSLMNTNKKSLIS